MSTPSSPLGWRPRLFMAAAMSLFVAEAQAFDVFWTAGNSSWMGDNNWDTLAVPDEFYEDVAIVNNGGVATLNTTAPDAAGLVLGQSAGESGSLVIQPGGSLNLIEKVAAPALVPPVGVANIGLDGRGTLRVQSGGAFSTTSLDVNAGSTVEIGGGAGVASVVSTDSMYLNGFTITHGPGHVFSADGFIDFEGSSQYIVDLQADTHTTLTTPGGINNLQGLLSIQTSAGYTPTAGDSWTILDGGAITGAGFVVDTALSPVPAGHAYRTRVSDGGNGKVLELSYDRYASLEVNTNTGAVTMMNASGTPIDIIGYSVLSDSGGLNPAGWTSMTEQSVAGWEETAPSPQSLSELNSQGSLALTGTAIQLGNVYVSPQEFGAAPNEVTFEYAVDGATTAVQGLVEYTGTAAANNLLLTVDPVTGDAQLQNGSRFTIDLVGYSILSDFGSLDGDNWTSLESQAVGDWDEAAPAANASFALSELVPDGVATLFPGQAFSLGQMFSLDGVRDLELEFLLMVDGVEEVRTGVVEYGPIPEIVSVPGDYNNDGVVNAADYTVWRDNLGPGSLPNEGGISPGVVDQADYDFWASRYGATAATSTSSAEAVPEPTGLVLLLAGALGRATGQRRR